MLKKLTKEEFPRLKKLWADNKYHNHGLNRWVSEHGWYVSKWSAARREQKLQGDPVALGGGTDVAWLGRCRIHSREYEREPSSSEAQIQISMIGLMLRRLSEEKHKAPFRYPRPQAKVAA